MSDILAELEWRGLLADCTDRAALAQRTQEGPITLYCGFDPTADSLHVGNLVPLFALRRFQLAGHHPIALAGGATGMVGDPSGKSDERNLLTPDQLAHNLSCIKPQLARFLDFTTAKNPARVVNNFDWTGQVTFLEFLRDIGKYITVNSMVAKDSVRSRMEERSTGISFTEFSYMLLQGFDFLHLRETLKCELQVGATDQWGNITVGTELTRKKLGATVWGLVFPLLTKSDGSKYGKTATGTVWLDPKRTSPYRFYQFFVNSDDADVVKLLKVLTFLTQDEITALENELKTNPGARAAQRALAREMTTLVHGPDECANAIRASEAIFGGQVTQLDSSQLDMIGREVPHKLFDPANPDLSAGFNPIGAKLVDAIIFSGLFQSKNQARQAIQSGGVYLNDQRVSDPTRAIAHADLLNRRHLVLRHGARNYVFLSAVTPISE
ncbi:MAG TPA: tyrosine--tRNA ligase [Candidatus Didemnitutus sp.]|nr:tyrosine--tRNA ligase [Candidatus Didemnitutus sp.]